MIRLHHEFNGPVVPTCLLLTAVQESTGRGDDAFALMQGASPVSSGRGPQLLRLAESIRQDHAAQRMLPSDKDGDAVLMFLAQHAGEVGSAYADYVDEVGYRLVGDALDHGSPYLLEAPELLVTSIRTAVEVDDEEAGQADLEQLAADVRSGVPQARRAEFDLLLHEARVTYAVRDERSIYTNVWAAGIFHHALRCGGRRLVDRGILAEPAHLVDATIGEVHALLGQAPDAPTGDDLAARARFRQEHATTPAPRHLGGSPSPPPPLEWLPSALARINAAVMVQVADAAVERQEDDDVLRGLAASRGTYTGTARGGRGTAGLRAVAAW